MSIKLYRLYCDVCNWNHITDGSDEISKNLIEVTTSPIPTGYPKIDDETKEIITPSPTKQSKKFKCPQCGRVIRANKVQDTQNTVEEKNNIAKRTKTRNEENWAIGRKEGIKRY